MKPDRLALLASPIIAGLCETDVTALARAADEVICSPSQCSCPAFGQDRRLFVVLEGRLAVQLTFLADQRCQGTCSYVLDRPGDILAWGLLMKPDHLVSRISCLVPSRLLAVDLARLPRWTSLALVKRLALYLYGELQRLGVCPPNTQALLGLRASTREQGCEGEELC